MNKFRSLRAVAVGDQFFFPGVPWEIRVTEVEKVEYPDDDDGNPRFSKENGAVITTAQCPETGEHIEFNPWSDRYPIDADVWVTYSKEGK